MIDDLVRSLRASSLQSKDQLLKVAAHFNIPSNKLSTDLNLLKEIFDARNEVAHEMDIDFTQTNRSRRPRKKDSMIQFTTEIFRISKQCLAEVDALLLKKEK